MRWWPWKKRTPEKFWHEMSNAERLAWLNEQMWAGRWFEVYIQRPDETLERYLMRIWPHGIEHKGDDPRIVCDYREDLWRSGQLGWERGTYHLRLSRIYHASRHIGKRT